MLLVLFSLDLSSIDYLDTLLFITDAENSGMTAECSMHFAAKSIL